LVAPGVARSIGNAQRAAKSVVSTDLACDKPAANGGQTVRSFAVSRGLSSVGIVNGPDYSGGGLVNLMAELELRLTGSAPNRGLDADLAATIPDAESIIFVLFDGLGDHQLSHPAAAPLLADRVGAIDAGFPTTTTVSMATVATGLTPAEHGLLGYQMWVPETGHVVNTIKWTTLWGESLEHDLDSFLPTPNLWERLKTHGVEPVTLQPWGFDDSPMSRMLYRGCRFEPWADEDDAADAAVQLAEVPGRFVFLYVPHLDFAAHVTGQDSDDYTEAMTIVARVWERMTRNLPDHVIAVATADHGHVDIAEDRRHRIPDPAHRDRLFGGDPRAPFVYGEVTTLAAELGVEWAPRADMQHWWGTGTRHPAFDDRAPDGVLLPAPGSVIFHKHGDERLIGQHGGLSDEERRIPLLVST
jgi:hypothetical protein